MRKDDSEYALLELMADPECKNANFYVYQKECDTSNNSKISLANVEIVFK